MTFVFLWLNAARAVHQHAAALEQGRNALSNPAGREPAWVARGH